MEPDQIAKGLKLVFADIDPWPAGREVRSCRQVEVPHQAFAEKIDFLRSKCLRVEITSATIPSTAAVVHVPDRNRECRVQIGCDSLGYVFDALSSVKQVEILVEDFGRFGHETIMDVDTVGPPVKNFHTPGGRRRKLSKLLIFPFDQGLLLMTMIDSQPHVFAISFQTGVAKKSTYEDVSAF
jgi:hypothetical protein